MTAMKITAATSKSLVSTWRRAKGMVTRLSDSYREHVFFFYTQSRVSYKINTAHNDPVPFCSLTVTVMAARPVQEITRVNQAVSMDVGRK